MMPEHYDPEADYYELLGVSDDVSPEDLKDTYRKLAKELHPDINSAPGAEQRLKAVNQAYEVLEDSKRRESYDALKLAHFDALPPQLRLSTNDLAFGWAGVDDVSEMVILLHNGGGYGEVSTSTSQGAFWYLSYEGSADTDPPDVVMRLLFTLHIPEGLRPGMHTDEIQIHLENEDTVSTQKLRLSVNAKPQPRAVVPVTDVATWASTPDPLPGARTRAPADVSARPLVGGLACLAYIVGPFIIMSIMINDTSINSDRQAWQGLVSITCFFWLLSSFVVVPHIWWWVTRSPRT